MLAFRKAITCLKKALNSSRPERRPFKDLKLKLEFGEGEAKASKLHQILCDFVGGICWDFLCVFVLCCLGRGSYWVFLAFVLALSLYCGYYCRRFPVLSRFVFVNRFPFYRHIVVVRSD